MASTQPQIVDKNNIIDMFTGKRLKLRVLIYTAQRRDARMTEAEDALFERLCFLVINNNQLPSVDEILNTIKHEHVDTTFNLLNSLMKKKILITHENKLCINPRIAWCAFENELFPDRTQYPVIGSPNYR